MAKMSERMAQALADARTAKHLFCKARTRFNTAVDAHRDDAEWPDGLRHELAVLRTEMNAARSVWIRSDQGIRAAHLYDRQAWIHGNGERPSSV